MVYVVVANGEVAGVFTSPVDAAERQKQLSARVFTCAVNSDLETSVEYRQREVKDAAPIQPSPPASAEDGPPAVPDP